MVHVVVSVLSIQVEEGVVAYLVAVVEAYQVAMGLEVEAQYLQEVLAVLHYLH